MSDINLNLEPVTSFIPISENTVCLDLDKTSLETLGNIVNTKLFQQIIDNLYIFVLFAVVFNLFVYYKFRKEYLKLDTGLKVGFIFLLFIQMLIYIYMSYLKFLIYYNYWYLALFFILLLPFFYVLIIYANPITEKILELKGIKLSE